MRSRLGLLFVLAAIGACSAHEAGSDESSSSDLVGAGLDHVAIGKVGSVGLGVNASFDVIDDLHAVWGAFGTTDKACAETPFTRYTTGATELNVLPKGAWTHGKVSADGKWVAAIGKADASCDDPASARELRVAPTDKASAGVSLGSSTDFDFAGDLVVRFEPGVARALRTTGEEAWMAPVSAGAAHAIAPDGSVLLYAPGSAQIVAADGTITPVAGFPSFTLRDGAAARITFVADGTAVAELPAASGYELWKIGTGGSERIATTKRMALWSKDKTRFVVLASDGAEVDVFDTVVLGHVALTGLDTVTRVALSANGKMLAVAGTQGGKPVVASASTAASAKIVVLGTAAAAVSDLQISDEGSHAVFSAGSGDARQLFVADTSAVGSLKQLKTDDLLGGFISFTLEPGAQPRSVLVEGVIHGSLVQLDGSGSADLPNFEGNIGWANGVDFYKLDPQDPHLAVVTRTGSKSRQIVPFESPLGGTGLFSAAISPSGRTLFVGAGLSTFVIDTASPAPTPPAAGSSSSSSSGGASTSSSGGATSTSSSSSGGATSTSSSSGGSTHSTSSSSSSSSSTSSSSGFSTGDNAGGGSAGATGGTGGYPTAGVSSGSSSTSASSTSSSGSSTSGAQPTASASSGGCSTTGGGLAGGASPLALGLVVSAMLRRRRRAV